MNVLFLGDIVGKPGRDALRKVLPHLKSKHNPDFIIANGENAAHGRGITSSIVKELLDLGVQGITMGNHTWDNKEIFQWIDEESRLIRPANFPDGTPGQGFMVLKKGNKQLAVINVQGRVFLPAIDCPFRKVDELIEHIHQQYGVQIPIVIDFHAEATSEKIAMGWYVDGRAALSVGTHTHVQSNDERLLPGGTAYITDVGMCGPMDGILGMERSAIIGKFISSLPARFEVDEQGPWFANGVFVKIDDSTGKALRIDKIRIDEHSLALI